MTSLCVALGYVIGGVGAGHAHRSVLSRKFDTDIQDALDQRLIRYALNTTGYGSNYINVHELGHGHSTGKPY